MSLEFGARSTDAGLQLLLRPIGGKIHGYLFENPERDIARSLLWNIFVECEPVMLQGEHWNCAFLADFLSWPARSWHDLEGMDLAIVPQPTMAASLYIAADHHPAQVSTLRLSDRQGASFAAIVTGVGLVDTDDGPRTVPISLSCRLELESIIVAKEDLPSPGTVDQARKALAAFLKLAGLREAAADDRRHLFEPET